MKSWPLHWEEAGFYYTFSPSHMHSNTHHTQSQHLTSLNKEQIIIGYLLNELYYYQE